MALVDVDGTTVGSATATASASINYGLGGTLVGSASNSAPSNPLHNLVETLQGSSSLSGDTERLLIFSGFSYGLGDLSDGLSLPVSGFALGQATVTGSIVCSIGVAGVSLGVSALDLSVPEPLYGFGILTAFMEVIHLPKPACSCTCPPTALHWMQDFQRGDLSICIQDRKGNPTGPFNVSYTLYQVVRGCTLKQVGCGDRKPASSGLGRYYVTGTAGEGGQPGSWVVRWRFQRSFGEPAVEQDVCFKVQDAIAAGDHTPRVCKYGWD
jgi:hypothetical protein